MTKNDSTFYCDDFITMKSENEANKLEIYLMYMINTCRQMEAHDGLKYLLRFFLVCTKKPQIKRRSIFLK